MRGVTDYGSYSPTVALSAHRTDADHRNESSGGVAPITGHKGLCPQTDLQSDQGVPGHGNRADKLNCSALVASCDYRSTSPSIPNAQPGSRSMSDLVGYLRLARIV